MAWHQFLKGKISPYVVEEENGVANEPVSVLRNVTFRAWFPPATSLGAERVCSWRPLFDVEAAPSLSLSFPELGATCV